MYINAISNYFVTCSFCLSNVDETTLDVYPLKKYCFKSQKASYPI